MAYTNLDYLRNITEGDSGSIREIIELFIEQVPEFIGNMKKHLEEKDYIALGKEAHKAKSSVMILGMDETGHNLKSLQLSTLNGTRVETYENEVVRFEKECLLAIAELNRELILLKK